MTIESIVAIALGLAVIVAGMRILRQALHRDRERRPRAWRLAAILLAQPVGALLLYLALFPPPDAMRADTLAVLTAGAEQTAAARIDGRRVALPEASAATGVERVPDLATALRRHPHVARLRVIGAGLTPRDRDAARGIDVDFEPAPLPRRLVELRAPRRVVRGARWRIAGRVERVPRGSVELRDPGGAVVASATPAGDGGFAFGDVARTPGRAVYRLRVLDAEQRVVEEVDVPLLTVAGSPLRLLLLSGAPGAELKYLRRWAADAGLRVHSRTRLSAGVHMADGPLAMNAAALRELDLVVLDERAWRSLGANGRRDLAEALRAGLGVLLRLTGHVSDAERSELRALGFEVADADIAQTVRLMRTDDTRSGSRRSADTARDGGDGAHATPTLSRRPLRVAARQGTALLRAEGGEPLALWRAEGRGRIALWWLSDSHRLVLGGDAPAHGSLWSRAVGVLARARGDAAPEWRGDDARVHQRQTLCRLAADARVVAPVGGGVMLSPDPAAAGDARDGTFCAGYWPAEPGWHVLRSGGGEWPFHVRGADDAAGLAANASREQTQRLAASRHGARAPVSLQDVGQRWPWFLAWLIVSAGLWWLERARTGRRSHSAAPA